MNKKILVGSIIAVAILVLVSFTGVVGFQSVKSDVKSSPLFNIRTNRAIGEESKDLNCKYVGKGITLPFPERNDKTIMVQNVIDRIRLMDDETFERFIAFIINYAQQDKGFNDVNPDGIREALNLVRDSDKPIPILDPDINLNQITGGMGLMTWQPTCCCITFDEGIRGILGCILGLLLLPFAFIWIIINIISDLLSPNCGGITCKIPCSARN